MGFSPSKRCIDILTLHNSKLVGLLFLETTVFACIKILRVTAFLIAGGPQGQLAEYGI